MVFRSIRAETIQSQTNDREKAHALYAPVLTYLAESPSRKPFGDWYDARTGVIEHFYNRSVQGGIFAPLLKEKGLNKEN